MTRLRDAVNGAPFVFVVGKGGTGKTTTAGALALEIADSGRPTHLISTDPAHSLGDLFGLSLPGAPMEHVCNADLAVEEFDASAYAEAWLTRSMPHVTEIIDAGTYLDREDVTAFSRLALPGLDEMMAVLRLVDLADAGRSIVVDTAPTGHTLRLLDAGATHEGVARALRAMADKAAAVAGSFARRAVRLTGEDVIDQLEVYVASYRDRVTGPAAFVVAARDEPMVAAETGRLIDELGRRGLRTVATVTAGTGAAARSAGSAARSAGLDLLAPWLDPATGCAALRDWRDRLVDGAAADADIPAQPAPNQNGTTPIAPTVSSTARTPASGADWLADHAPRLVLFAGKGGVGKTTCAAAAALALAETREVLLCSTDPAGSLDDVFGAPVTGALAEGSASGGPGRLRILQADPQTELESLRDAYHEDVVEALGRLGLSSSAELDRRVIDALFDLAPPGIDEVAALTTMLDSAVSGETVVIDSAPTGHFLRLLGMPALALDWTRQLMRVVVKYGLAGGDGGAAEALLRLSRELRMLQERLRDGADAAVVVVTLDDALVAAETRRLEHALASMDVTVLARLINRSVHPPVGSEVAGPAVIAVPEMAPPVGERALREFIAAWKIL